MNVKQKSLPVPQALEIRTRRTTGEQLCDLKLFREISQVRKDLQFGLICSCAVCLQLRVLNCGLTRN
jgi:hypothetical protein